MNRVSPLVFLCVAVVRLDADCQSCAKGTQCLRYSFEPIVSEGKLTLHTQLEFRGGPTGEAELVLPFAWGGNSQLAAAITNLAVQSEATSIADPADPSGKVVRFPPGALVRLSYDLIKDWSGPLREAVRHRALLEPGYFQINTNNALVHPKLAQSSAVQVEFDWQKLPTNWSLATSFGVNERCQSYRGAWYGVQNALFAGGDFRIHRVLADRRPLIFAIRGKWGFSDEHAMEKIQKLIRYERAFWRDRDFPYFLVTLAQFERDDGSTGGSAFTNAFSEYLSPHASFSYGVESHLAHEIFHTWNPYRLGRMPDATEDLYWFSEGFTTYYQDVVLLRASLLSFPDYVQKTNSKLRDYSLSPAASRGPYLRGAVIALWLNWQIRQSTRDKFSLDTLLFDLKRENSAHTRGAQNPPLTNERIFRVARKYVSSDKLTRLQEYVDGSVTVEAPPSALGPCVGLRMVDMPAFDLGFDRETLLGKHLVTGIDVQSEAYKAGLRNGDRVGGMSINWNDPSQPVKLQVADKPAIAYYPHGQSAGVVPQYYLDEKRYSEKPKECAPTLKDR
jgi:predicted metalloprotease with PDZ domain